ncbi:MAG: DUF805 domain-containing protein [Endomicrobiaceae bacterium]|nr:DUF805 domain-containing protein [Endomicrobiaceae bacterium]
MGLKNYCKTYFLDIITKHFFDFKGRAGRKTYWLFILNSFAISLAIAAVFKDSAIGIIVSMVYSLFIFLPILGLDVRRLHDINLSAWWLLIVFVPVLGAVVLFILACLPGTEGDNNYGPSEIKLITEKAVE